MHKVKRSVYIEDYKVLLEFDDGSLKIVDLKKEIWGPVFEPLKDIEFFEQVEVKRGTLSWPNEVDFCPDVLYKMGTDFKKNKPKKPAKMTNKRTIRRPKIKT